MTTAGPLSDPPARRRCGSAGFTLLETIVVIGMLALAAAGLLSIQPRIHQTQNAFRDQVTGLELQRSCADRLLLIRRKLGYANVTTASCNGLGGLGGYAANPTVSLRDASNGTVSACASATCTVTITVAKTTGSQDVPPALTLQFSNY